MAQVFKLVPLTVPSRQSAVFGSGQDLLRLCDSVSQLGIPSVNLQGLPSLCSIGSMVKTPAARSFLVALGGVTLPSKREAACESCCYTALPVLGTRVGKPSGWGPVGTDYSVFLTMIQGKTMAKPFEAQLLRGYTAAIITAHAPGPHIWPSRDPGLDSIASGNNCISCCFCCFKF